jgi:hypothetical protein
MNGQRDFTTNLPSVAGFVETIRDTGGTPLYAKLTKSIQNPRMKPTRVIAFSDGSATDGFARITPFEKWNSGELMQTPSHEKLVEAAKEAKIVIDTCYIADHDDIFQPSENYRDGAEETLKRIAQDTGGIFLKFVKGKCDFRRGFKYLTKGNRLLLLDDNFKSKLEAGQI